MDTPAAKPSQTVVSRVLVVFAPGEWESDESVDWMRMAIREAINTLPPRAIVLSAGRTLAEHNVCLMARQLRYGTIEVEKDGTIVDSRMPLNQKRQWAIGERPTELEHQGYLNTLAVAWDRHAPTGVLFLSDQRLTKDAIESMGFLGRAGLSVYTRSPF